MKRHEHVAAERQLAKLGTRPIGKHLLGFSTLSPTLTIGFWLMQVFWFERRNLTSW